MPDSTEAGTAPPGSLPTTRQQLTRPSRHVGAALKVKRSLLAPEAAEEWEAEAAGGCYKKRGKVGVTTGDEERWCGRVRKGGDG